METLTVSGSDRVWTTLSGLITGSVGAERKIRPNPTSIVRSHEQQNYEGNIYKVR